MILPSSSKQPTASTPLPQKSRYRLPGQTGSTGELFLRDGHVTLGSRLLIELQQRTTQPCGSIQESQSALPLAAASADVLRASSAGVEQGDPSALKYLQKISLQVSRSSRWSHESKLRWCVALPVINPSSPKTSPARISLITKLRPSSLESIIVTEPESTTYTESAGSS